MELAHVAITGDAKYADVMELELYNAILSGISLNGNNFFYTNPLSASGDFPYTIALGRWTYSLYQFIELLSAQYRAHHDRSE